jgi:SAM-dependent methyltransferase
MNGVEDRVDSASAWSQYWSAGRLSSCPGAADSNYTGAIEQCWKAWFELLPEACELLDIACGNGALLLLGHRHSLQQQKNWRLTGVDRAEVQRRSDLNHPDIRIIGGVDMHALPMHAAALDAVCSQYGIEYGVFPHNLDEAMRVLKPGGRFQFLVHCADSAIARRAGLQLQQIEWLQQEWHLFWLLKEMLQTRSQPQRFTTTKQTFDDHAGKAFAYLRSLQAEGQDTSLIEQTLQQLGGIWQQRDQHNQLESLQACADAEQALLSLRQRLHDQQAAMLDREQIQTWLQHLDRHADGLDLHALKDAGHQLGWAIGGSKRA